MNRIIIIGNGFDLAHGLPSGYMDFINSYWKGFVRNFTRYIVYPFEDEFAKFEWKNGADSYCTHGLGSNHFFNVAQEIESYDDLKQLIKEVNNLSDTQFSISFKNRFFESISEKTCLSTWLDIENEYYCLLKSLLSAKNSNESVKELNREFNDIKECLEEYLTDVCNQEVQPHDSIKVALSLPIKSCEIANSKKEMLIKEVSVSTLLSSYHPSILLKRFVKESDAHLSKLRIERNIFLNFNYTNTAKKLYATPKDVVINIHGELNSKSNSIIFGYGDELDDDYKNIEKLQDNDFLENIKSIKYHKTRNYREMLSIIESDPYQVFVMGHSCGNSDRTLLNTLFEHNNCVSVKVFYRQFEDGTDDYSNLIRNISRNFNDKPKMRDVVVNWEDCSPLVPVAIKNSPPPAAKD